MNFEFYPVIFRFDGSEEKWLKKLFSYYIILFQYIDKVFWNKN